MMLALSAEEMKSLLSPQPKEFQIGDELIPLNSKDRDGKPIFFNVYGRNIGIALSEILISVNRLIKTVDLRCEKSDGAVITDADLDAPNRIIICPNGRETPDPETLTPVIGGLDWKHPFAPDDNIACEEYHIITVDSAYCAISRSKRGLFYAMQTLIQFFKIVLNTDAEEGAAVPVPPEGIPAIRVHDWPDLAYRMIHVDLKYSMFKPPYYAELLKTYAQWKINTVVVEYEDKFPFSGDLEPIVHEAAFTQDELRNYLEIAKDYHIEVIPLCQSLGHFNYVLNHEEFAHLKENPVEQSRKKSSMMCPLNTETASFVKEMHSQILQFHKTHPSDYFHMGMDETYNIGTCERCKLLGEQTGGKSRLFINHANRISKALINRGKKPIIWTDMLIKHPESLDKLDDRIIMCYWEYNQPIPKDPDKYDPTYKTIDWVRIDSHYTPGDYAEIDPQIKDYYDQYVFAESPDAKNAFRTTPFIHFFKDRGYEVIPAPATQCCRKTPIFPEYELHLRNIPCMIRAAIKEECMGIFCTNWMVRQSFRPTLIYGECLFGALAWNYIEDDLESASRGWLYQYFMPRPEFTERILDLWKVHLDLGIRPIKPFYAELQEAAEDYSKIMVGLGDSVQTNSGIFDALHFSVSYISWESEFNLYMDELDEILIKYDEGSQPLPLLDELEERYEKLRGFSEKLGLLKNWFSDYISRHEREQEFDYEMDLRFTDYEKSIDVYLTWFSDMLGGIEQIMNDAIQRKFQFGTQKSPKSRLDSLMG